VQDYNRLDGYSLPKVASQLNRLGISAPCGGDWDKQKVVRLVSAYRKMQEANRPIPAPSATLVANAATLFRRLEAAGLTDEEAFMTIFTRHSAGTLS
jgi:hypothetical protein